MSIQAGMQRQKEKIIFSYGNLKKKYNDYEKAFISTEWYNPESGSYFDQEHTSPNIVDWVNHAAYVKDVLELDKCCGGNTFGFNYTTSACL